MTQALSFADASAASTFDFRIEGLQFCSSVVDLELPVEAALFVVAVLLPGGDRQA
jgi:hypothetical protein